MEIILCGKYDWTSICFAEDNEKRELDVSWQDIKMTPVFFFFVTIVDDDDDIWNKTEQDDNNIV